MHTSNIIQTYQALFWNMYACTYIHIAKINEKRPVSLKQKGIYETVWREEKEKRCDYILILK